MGCHKHSCRYGYLGALEDVQDVQERFVCGVLWGLPHARVNCYRSGG